MQAHIISTPDSIAPVIEKLNFSRMDEEKEHIIVYNNIKFDLERSASSIIIISKPNR